MGSCRPLTVRSRAYKAQATVQSLRKIVNLTIAVAIGLYRHADIEQAAQAA